MWMSVLLFGELYEYVLLLVSFLVQGTAMHPNGPA